MGERQSFQQLLLGNLDSCMQISETRTHSHTMHQNKPKMDEKHKYKTRHHQTPERKHRQNILRYQPHEYFLRSFSQSNRNKSKNKPMGPNQTEKLCTAKETKKKTKRQLTEWGKTVSNDATVKGLISKIDKQLMQLNSKKNQQPNQKNEQKT